MEKTAVNQYFSHQSDKIDYYISKFSIDPLDGICEIDVESEFRLRRCCYELARVAAR